jgi:hypothetical protein
MIRSTQFSSLIPALCAALFFAMLALLELGRRLGRRYERIDATGAHSGTGTIEGSIFALLGLLIAFTFSGAAARFEARRNIIVEEANAVGTAYLRLDQAPAEFQPQLRDLFRRYLDLRLHVYSLMPDVDAALAELARATGVQDELWSAGVSACASAKAAPSCSILLLPALNAVIDFSTSHAAAQRNHPPTIIFWLLCALGLGCSVLAGYSMAPGVHRKWPHTLAFAAMISATLYVTLDMEYPRLGLIRVDDFDQVLVDVRSSMNR